MPVSNVRNCTTVHSDIHILDNNQNVATDSSVDRQSVKLDLHSPAKTTLQQVGSVMAPPSYK